MMTVGQLLRALELAPSDAEILVVSEEMGEEIALEGPTGFAYCPAEKVVILKLEEDMADEETPPWDEDDPEDGTQLSRFYRPRRSQPVIVEGEVCAIIPEEKGDPDSTAERYGEEA